MKTNTLKFKAVIMAIALAGLSHASVHAMGSDGIELASAHENEFIEQMFTEIRDAVNATIDLVESFTEKTNKESLSAFLTRCMKQIKHIEDNILAKLEAELKIAKATQPNSDYCKALEKTYKFGKEQAYKELVTFYNILDKHRKDPAKAKNAMELVTVLKPHLQKLISTATLDLLDKSLTDISQHLDSAEVATEIANLKAMVKEIRAKAAAMQGKVNAGLLAIISARLQKL
ncbi:hypothetical protein BH09DEP1_BH09DEP1_3630 [soil metagenome]